MVDKLRLKNTRFKIWPWVYEVIAIVALILLQRITNPGLRTTGVTLIAIGFVLIIQRLINERQRLLQAATLDDLTGLGNFRAYQERMRYETQRALRKRVPFTLILIDLDQFKNYNDSYGHRSGNDLLYSAGQIFRNAVRAIDGVYRFGGDEFAVVLPETDLEEARCIAKRIRHSFEDLPNRGTVTLSMGMDIYREEPLGEFFDRVDCLLYDVKANGGNCCQSESSGSYPSKGISITAL